MPRFADGLGRVCALVAVSTAALTASFVGLVALASGDVQGATARFPIYVTAMAIVFVGCIVAFEESRHQGRRALLAAALAAVATLLVTGLGGEGVVYALDNPEVVFEVQLFGYLLSASMMGTGFGYWTWRNWQSLRVAGIGDAL